MIKSYKVSSFVNFGLIVFLSTLALAQSINPYLSSYLDNAFKHPQTQQTRNSNTFQIIDYDEMRDVNGRDEIPVTKALDSRVNQLVNSKSTSSRIEGLNLYKIGNIEGASFGVIFIHGAGGDRSLGFNDWSFGGNFNRLKNLVDRNNGYYLSPSVNFNTRGFNKMKKLIERLNKINPGAKIVVACGSVGSSVCWDLASSSQHAKKISGLVFLGSALTSLCRETT